MSDMPDDEKQAVIDDFEKSNCTLRQYMTGLKNCNVDIYRQSDILDVISDHLLDKMETWE